MEQKKNKPQIILNDFIRYKGVKLSRKCFPQVNKYKKPTAYFLMYSTIGLDEQEKVAYKISVGKLSANYLDLKDWVEQKEKIAAKKLVENSEAFN